MCISNLLTRLSRTRTPISLARAPGGACWSRLLPVLVFLLGLPAAEPATAQTTIWSATLTVKTAGESNRGCHDELRDDRSCSSALSDNDFSYGGTGYTVVTVNNRNDGTSFTLGLQPAVPAAFATLGAVLNLGSTQLDFEDASLFFDGALATWRNPGLSWTVNQQVSVSIVLPPPRSSNANLSGLTASIGTSPSVTFTPLTLTPSTFTASTTSYTATVAHSITHAKLTPTVEDTGKATVTVQGNPVTSGSSSGAIRLNPGSNALSVRVTAENGTTKDYTVTITREEETTIPEEDYTLTLRASNERPAEGSTVTLTATLDKPAPAGGATFHFIKAAGSAQAGRDFSLSPAGQGQTRTADISISAGETTFTATLEVIDDAEGEDDETIVIAVGSSLTLTNNPRLTLTIPANDGGGDGNGDGDGNGNGDGDGNGDGNGDGGSPDDDGDDGNGDGNGGSGGGGDGDGDAGGAGGESPAVNNAPEAASDTAQTPEDTEVVIEVLANDTDADGDALRIESVTSPANGTARITGSAITYVPAADWHGTDRFTYTVTDGQGGTSEALVEVTVEPVNDAPVATADMAQTLEDTEVAIDVLANDTDADGDALRIESVTSPTNGTARITGRTITYAPAAGWHGTDRFTYTVTDGQGGMAEAPVEVTVQPVNDAPVATADMAQTPEDTEVAIDVLANDTDADGDALRIESVTSPANGTARITGRTITYAPAAGWHGTDRSPTR